MNENELPTNSLRVMLAGGALLVLAFIIWEVRDFVPEFFASQINGTATLSTTAEKDDARVLRAFKEARDTTHADARLVTEPDPNKPVRNADLTVTASSSEQALADLTAMTETMQQVFAKEGPGEFLVNARRGTTPVPNNTMTTTATGLRAAAAALFLIGLLVIFGGWRASRLPKQVLWAIGITIVLCALYAIPEGTLPASLGPYAITMPIPLVLAAVIFYKTREVRKAATWSTGKAVIKSSRSVASRHRFGGDTTQVKNQPEVRYEFTVGDRTYQSERISIGDNPADALEEVLKRYHKGAEVPVYYNPAKPEECVLERDAPVSIGCLRTVAVIGLLIGLAFGWLIQHGGSIDQSLKGLLPGATHPLMAVCIGGMGVLCALMFIAGLMQARQTANWTSTQGTVVSNEVESFYSSSDGSSSRGRPVHKAVIEYRYQAGGVDYHSSRRHIGVESASGNRSKAEQEAALYMPGLPVTVYYDPQDPSSAVLTRGYKGGLGMLLLTAALLGLAWWVAYV